MKTAIILLLIGFSVHAPRAVYAQWHGVVHPARADSLIPKGYYFEDYFPIPFSPLPWDKFGIAETCHVTLWTTDTLNQAVYDTVYSAILAPGNYWFDFSGRFGKPGWPAMHLHLRADNARSRVPGHTTTYEATRRTMRYSPNLK